jgi:hypothetical protein
MSKKKKEAVSSAPSRNDGLIDFIGLHTNISRMAEICKVGGHTITFFYAEEPNDPSRSVKPRDIEQIIDELELADWVDEGEDGDILCEIVRPEFSSIEFAMRRVFESPEDIEARINKASDFDEPGFDTINTAGMSLLKTAYERLGLGVYEIDIIRDMAQTIARMHYSKEIRTEYVAEAIQYRSIERDKLKVYKFNKD